MPKEDKLTDINNPDIYVRKIKQSAETNNGRVKKRQRLQNSVHACVYCGLLVQHIQVHVFAKHHDEKDVKELQEKLHSGKKGKKRKEKLDAKMPLSDHLRARGDHKHNMCVLEKGKGELLLYRRPKERFDHKDFGPCPNCEEWMLADSLKKHQKTCSVKKISESVVKETKRNIQLESNIILGNVQATSEQLKTEVFSMMTRDHVTKTAQGDKLICLLGESSLRRNIGNPLKRKYYASGSMRQAAKLLHAARERAGDEELSMWDCLRPSFGDIIVESSLDIAIRGMDDEEELKSPSTAIKVRYDLLKMARAKKSLSTKELDKDRENNSWKIARDEAVEFLEDVAENWDEKVSKKARQILEDRKINRAEHLPDPQDVEKLSKHLVEVLSKSDLSKDGVTWERYKHTTMYVQARLLMYNKRRSGELEAVL